MMLVIMAKAVEIPRAPRAQAEPVRISENLLSERRLLSLCLKKEIILMIKRRASMDKDGDDDETLLADKLLR
jgi:hypothetical protein